MWPLWKTVIWIWNLLKFFGKIWISLRCVEFFAQNGPWVFFGWPWVFLKTHKKEPELGAMVAKVCQSQRHIRLTGSELRQGTVPLGLAPYSYDEEPIHNNCTQTLLIKHEMRTRSLIFIGRGLQFQWLQKKLLLPPPTTHHHSSTSIWGWLIVGSPHPVCGIFWPTVLIVEVHTATAL